MASIRKNRRPLSKSPPAEIIHGILNLWQGKKKNADVVLVLDISGSMNDDGKLANAKVGARQLDRSHDDGDSFSLLPFSNALPGPRRTFR